MGILRDARIFFVHVRCKYIFSSLVIYFFGQKPQEYISLLIISWGKIFLRLPHPLYYFSNGPSCIIPVPKCPMYDAPENGALVCLNRDADGSASFCQVACKDGTGFNFDPPLLYICAGPGFWMTEILRRVNQLPWPNCSSTWFIV